MKHSRLAAMVAMGLGIVALLARPRGTLTAVLITAGVGLIGFIVPVPAGSDQPRVPPWQWVLITALGIAAFLAARLAIILIPVPISAAAVSTGMLAAVAEEVFFRRLVYGWLERWGSAAAIACSAILFAAIHLPTYGWEAMPVDLTAGILFGWQRWASGTWLVPAVTHIAANLLQLG